MGWFSIAFTLETPLPREEVNRRLAAAVVPWSPFGNLFNDRYFGEVEPGGFDFTGPAGGGPWSRSPGWTAYRVVGAVRALPSGGARIEVKVRLSYGIQLFLLCLVPGLILLLREVHPQTMEGWLAASGVGCLVLALVVMVPVLDWLGGGDRARAWFARVVGEEHQPRPPAAPATPSADR